MLYQLFVTTQDPVRFWSAMGLIAIGAALLSAHVRWVRPYFRRFYWVIDYPELVRRTLRLNGHKGESMVQRHPKVVFRFWRARLYRSAYRIGIAALVAPLFWGMYQLYGSSFLWFLGLYVVTGLGITIGFHRNGAHISFKAPDWLRAILFSAGVWAIQGLPKEWMKKHAGPHHTFADSSLDVHSPLVLGQQKSETRLGVAYEHTMAFAHSFVIWAFRAKSLSRPKGMSIEEWIQTNKKEVPDLATFHYRECDAPYWQGFNLQGKQILTPQQKLEKTWIGMWDTIERIERDKVVSFISQPFVYSVLVFLSFFLPWYIGGVTLGEACARVVFTSWVTFGVNSVCHLWGEKPFNTPDHSQNNAFIEVLALGEGGHANHHYRASWAEHGIFPWQLDVSAEVIKALGLVGIIDKKSIKLPRKREVILAAAYMERGYRAKRMERKLRRLATASA
ncbi:MAG TPA: hypothetical protein VLA04_03135 [Verrucomicrobiae bacterium]|nr:hypothetical protein [Verrucomicrobiae bacterium]